jgi:hypothetical protein
MVAGVGQPVGVLGFEGWLWIEPLRTSSESRFGVNKVFFGEGPAPEIPGTVERRVFPRKWKISAELTRREEDHSEKA